MRRPRLWQISLARANWLLSIAGKSASGGSTTPHPPTRASNPARSNAAVNACGPVIVGGFHFVTRVACARIATSSSTVSQNANPGALAITALHARRVVPPRASTTACACGSWPTKQDARARHRVGSFSNLSFSTRYRSGSIDRSASTSRSTYTPPISNRTMYRNTSARFTALGNASYAATRSGKRRSTKSRIVASVQRATRHVGWCVCHVSRYVCANAGSACVAHETCKTRGTAGSAASASPRGGNALGYPGISSCRKSITCCAVVASVNERTGSTWPTRSTPSRAGRASARASPTRAPRASRARRRPRPAAAGRPGGRRRCPPPRAAASRRARRARIASRRRRPRASRDLARSTRASHRLATTRAREDVWCGSARRWETDSFGWQFR